MLELRDKTVEEHDQRAIYWQSSVLATSWRACGPQKFLFLPFSFRLKQRSLALRVKLGVFFFSSSTSGVRVPVKQPKIEVRVYAKICGFAYLKKKITKREKKQAWRSASISVVCNGPVRANPRMHPPPSSAVSFFFATRLGS